MVGLIKNRINTSLRRTFLFYLVLISISAKIFAQDVNSLSKQYPDELAIYLNKKKSIFLDIHADTLTINTENFSEMIYLKDNANILSEKEIYYSGMLKVSEVEAKCMIPKGDGGMRTIKVTEFIDENVQERGIFFNDSKVKKFIYPSLQRGAKSSLFYKESYLEPRLFGPYFFSAEAMSLNSELSITYNNKIEIGYKVLGIEETALEKSEVKKGSKIITTWKMKNVPRLERDANAPNIRYYAPQIIVYIKSLKLKNGTVNYSSNYKELYQWTYNLVKGINKDSEKEIKGLVDSLLIGAKTDLEKSKRIFYWVQDNIRYIAFEDGYGGFIPRDAEKVYRKRYGDCKDMANITTYMHKLASIPAYLTLIGSRDIPYAVSEIPSSCNFNHMIATVKLDDKYYFLDATGKYQLHGQPTSMIQDKEGLIVMGKDSCMVLKVPLMERNKNKIIDTVHVDFEKNSLKGRGKRYMEGYPKITFAHVYGNLDQEDKVDYFNSFLSKGNNKCKVTNPIVKNASEREKPTIVKFDFKVEDYSLKSGKEVFINLNLNKDLSSLNFESSNRKTDFEEDYKYEMTEVTTLNIPKGYKVKYIPDNKKINEKDFGFEIQYELKKDKLVYTKKIYIDFLILKKDQFPTWNKMIKELNKAYKENISIVEN
ncbi:hypothetical protein MYP_3157 [Sporocytophaga myxococcoides]|uniref:Transglutaminase-like domain-containing protein n=1 Tax=Sporocytophaga myxococcoides TaxID=153721 RepID=A0A098LIF0_9BACT|nr:transglutaminase domain-containing protein [Sporocytophaga myxococcoides]GAL85928.1 hypothetical protein MYP_3157 [Sporocytophaga myxococcoides]